MIVSCILVFVIAMYFLLTNPRKLKDYSKARIQANIIFMTISVVLGIYVVHGVFF